MAPPARAKRLVNMRVVAINAVDDDTPIKHTSLIWYFIFDPKAGLPNRNFS